MNIYGFPEGSCVIPNKVAYMGDENCEKVVKVVAPGIIKMKVSDVACVFHILFSIYLTIYIHPYYIHTICDFPKWWSFLTCDGFKSHVNVTYDLEFFLLERIKVGKEEADTSALN